MKRFFVGIAMIVFVGCLKNQEKAANVVSLSIGHYAINAQPLDVLFDGQKINATPLSFGNISGTGSNIYLNAPAGTHTLVVNQGSTPLYNKVISTSGNSFYSMLFTDSIRNDKVNLLLIREDTTTIDSLAKARFWHFMPGNDTLSLLLIKNLDTGRVALGIPYMGANTEGESIQTYDVAFYPGNYRLELFNQSGLIYTNPSVVLDKRKNYSFIAKGVTGGTGDKAPSVAVIRNN